MRDELEVEMETILYSCGSVFENIDAGEEDNSVLTNIHVRANLNCRSQMGSKLCVFTVAQLKILWKGMDSIHTVKIVPQRTGLTGVGRHSLLKIELYIQYTYCKYL